jgi:acyl-CoA synthetase (AMP-forming)/AMP-acid ligase II
MINTDLITEDFKFYPITSDTHIDKTQFVSLVSRWKYLLAVKYGCKKGDVAAIAVMGMTCNHIAILFALAELGASALLLDAPVNNRTIHKTKAALYAPIAFAIEDQWCRLMNEGLHHKMLKLYSKIIIDEKEIDSVTEEYTERFNEPSDVFLCSSTSGSTGDSKKIFFTQEEVYKISRRNVDVFKFDKNSRVGYTKNMHHASCMLTQLLPALMVSEHHFQILTSVWSLFGQPHIKPSSNNRRQHVVYTEHDFLKRIRKNKINHVLLVNSFIVNTLLRDVEKSGKFEETLLINVSGFVIPKDYIEKCKEWNVEFISHFGQVNGAIPLLVNYVTADSQWIPGNLGVVPDDFYKLREVEEGQFSVSCELWSEERIVDDKLKVIEVDGQKNYLHGGRSTELTSYELILRRVTTEYALFKDPTTDKFIVVLWEPDQQLPVELFPLTHSVYHLDKLTFTTETKVNMEQLGAHLGVR